MRPTHPLVRRLAHDASRRPTRLFLGADVVLAVGTEFSELDWWALDGAARAGRRADPRRHRPRQPWPPARARRSALLGDAGRDARRRWPTALAERGAARPTACGGARGRGAARRCGWPAEVADAPAAAATRSTRRCRPTASSPSTPRSPATRPTTCSPSSGPGSWLSPIGYGCLGCALPMAIGAKLAAPERPVLALAGDGGVLFTIQELATAARPRPAAAARGLEQRRLRRDPRLDGGDRHPAARHGRLGRRLRRASPRASAAAACGREPSTTSTTLVREALRRRRADADRGRPGDGGRACAGRGRRRGRPPGRGGRGARRAGGGRQRGRRLRRRRPSPPSSSSRTTPASPGTATSPLAARARGVPHRRPRAACPGGGAARHVRARRAGRGRPLRLAGRRRPPQRARRPRRRRARRRGRALRGARARPAGCRWSACVRPRSSWRRPASRSTGTSSLVIVERLADIRADADAPPRACCVDGDPPVPADARRARAATRHLGARGDAAAHRRGGPCGCPGGRGRRRRSCARSRRRRHPHRRGPRGLPAAGGRGAARRATATRWYVTAEDDVGYEVLGILDRFPASAGWRRAPPTSCT